MVVSVEEKSRHQTVAGVDQGDERKQTTDEVSKQYSGCQNRSSLLVPGSARREPAYWPCGIRHRGGMTLIQAFVRNVGTRPVMARENPISEDHEGGKYRCTERGRIIL